MFTEKYFSFHSGEHCIKFERFVDYKDSALFRVKHATYIGQAIVEPSGHSFTFSLMDDSGKTNVFTLSTWNTRVIASELVDFFEISDE